MLHNAIHQHSASSTASLKAWFAPCALNGVIGCAASPMRVTLGAVQPLAVLAVGEARSDPTARGRTRDTQTFRRAVSHGISGMGSCQSAQRRNSSALSLGGSLDKAFAVSSAHGKDNCHIVDVVVNGMA